jgi:hypothetical protein
VLHNLVLLDSYWCASLRIGFKRRCSIDPRSSLSNSNSQLNFSEPKTSFCLSPISNEYIWGILDSIDGCAITLYYLTPIGAQVWESALKGDAPLTQDPHSQTQILNSTFPKQKHISVFPPFLLDSANLGNATVSMLSEESVLGYMVKRSLRHHALCHLFYICSCKIKVNF